MNLELWQPEFPLFAGETVFCLASGPSLTQDIADRLKGRRVVAVNSSVKLAPFADVLFFTDNGWFEYGRDPKCHGSDGNDLWPRRKFIEEFPGQVICLSKVAKRCLPRKVKLIRCQGEPTDNPPRHLGAWPPHQGRTSGHTAISLAISLGAARVVLLGYDMRLLPYGGPYTNPDTGSQEERDILAKSSHPRHYEMRARYREHHHSEYSGPRDLFIYETDFIPAFRGWHAKAREIGVEIVNCTPGSAVKEFPFLDLDEVLSCARS